MDHFGIGQAMRGMALAYISASRHTGRTTSLVESLKDGDRVVCATDRETRHMEELCRERGLKVQCLTLAPALHRNLLNHGTSEGRTILDHTWVEQFYLARLGSAQEVIDMLQRETSGYGTAHIETRRQAIERSKWEFPG